MISTQDFKLFNLAKKTGLLLTAADEVFFNLHVAPLESNYFKAKAALAQARRELEDTKAGKTGSPEVIRLAKLAAAARARLEAFQKARAGLPATPTPRPGCYTLSGVTAPFRRTRLLLPPNSATISIPTPMPYWASAYAFAISAATLPRRASPSSRRQPRLRP